MDADDIFLDLPPVLRRKVQDALLQRQMQGQAAQGAFQPRPTEYTPQGQAVKQSPLEHLLRAAAGGVHKYNERAYANLAEKELSSAEQGRASDFGAVQQALLGQPSRELPGPQPAGVEGPLMGLPVQPSVEDAILQASKSSYPSVRGFGSDLQKRQLDQRGKLVEELLKNATPQSQQAMLSGGGPQVLQPKPNYMPLGDSLVATNPNQPGITPLTPERFQPGQKNIAGVQMPTNLDTFTGKETPMGGANVTANPVSASRGRISNAMLDTIQKNRPEAEAAARDMENLFNIGEKFKKDYTSGSFADWRVEISKFSKLLGLPEDPKAINAEVLKTMLGERVLDRAKTLGANPSNADRERIEQIAGRINTDPKALGELLQYGYMMSTRGLAAFNGMVARAEMNESEIDPNVNYDTFRVYPSKVPENDMEWMNSLQNINRGKPAGTPGRKRIQIFGE